MEPVFTGSPRLPKTGDMDDNLTIFGHGYWEHVMVNDIKAPLDWFIEAFMSPKSSNPAKFKALLNMRRALQVFQQFPEPTRENTRWKNTEILFELRDKFFKLENNPGRDNAFKLIWKFIIILYDYDPYYQQRIDWLVDEFKSLLPLWEAREPGFPRPPHWREFEPKL
jgi:hypothetical protein